MDNTCNWFDKHLCNTNSFDDSGLGFSNCINSNLMNYNSNMLGFKPYIESSSSSTTHISENVCFSKSESFGENYQTNLYDDEDWSNSLESCFSCTIDGELNGIYQGCPQEASSKDSLEEQLNNYFSRTFGNYNSGVQPHSVKKLDGLAERVNNSSKTKTLNDTTFCSKGSSSISPEGTVIFSNSANQKAVLTSSNVSTDCGLCEFIPVTNTSPSSASQLSDQVKSLINADSSAFNGFNTPKDSLTAPISTKSNNTSTIKGTFTPAAPFTAAPNVSNGSNFPFGANLLTTQLSGSIFGDIFPGNEMQNTLSDVGNETYKESFDSINYFNKDAFNSNDLYYKSLHNKDIDLIFNNMDSMSRVDNLLNKDISDFNVQPKDLGLDLISDYNSDIISGEMLNNDVLFSEIYRDHDTDDSEVWDNMMKRLCISSNLNKYYPKLLNESKQETPNPVKNTPPNPLDNPELGITLKNKDNIPSILPADPNLGFKKTSLCKYWQRGICANDDCNFAHGKKELRSTIGVWRTTICHHWKTGICRVGKDCRHAHGEEELQPKNIPANVLKNKLLNSARKYEYMRKKKNTY